MSTDTLREPLPFRQRAAGAGAAAVALWLWLESVEPGVDVTIFTPLVPVIALYVVGLPASSVLDKGLSGSPLAVQIAVYALTGAAAGAGFGWLLTPNTGGHAVNSIVFGFGAYGLVTALGGLLAARLLPKRATWIIGLGAPIVLILRAAYLGGAV